ncbi:MFS family permease [Allocatelliglobosispora scoriae]|uniref:MFS family permease n=1 Tax=Allocatelliglobosispora scoriae TaxID=643052 RepID=A0A841BPZ5_9ACTN|nr:MFS transporter [Allocatelliglobosispora scoriae]MBB5870334.1 MFS family permease [Allocatelliglobosispora scoriae]
MYLSTISRPTTEPTEGQPRRRRLIAISANVFALGAVSLVTDISSEMVSAVLPLYLVLGLQLSPMAYGVIDGVYTGATAVLRLVGGYLADRFRGRKVMAGIGYGISAVAKLGLLAAGRSVTGIGLVIAADRMGKGLRTAPRDALITLSTPPEALGRAFGVHRMMDSFGAFLGPLVALGVLAAAGGSYDAVFVTSFCVAVLGVVLLVLFVRDRHDPGPSPVRAVRPREALTLLHTRPVRRLALAACLLGLATIGDGFVFLLLQRREELSIVWFPLLAVGTSLAYLLLAAPMGALADLVGRVRVLIGGYTALVLAYLLLFGPLGGWPMLVLTLGLYGLFYAATDGVLMALAGPVLPERLRTTGIALIQTGQALAYLVSSVLFGAAWQVWGPAVASRIAAAAVVLAIIATVFLLLRPAAEELPA